jgi:hypothetical protein
MIMKNGIVLWVALGAAVVVSAQAKKPYQSQATSSLSYSVKDGQEIVDITNVEFELAGAGIPGRPRDEYLQLRKTTKIHHIMDAVGIEAFTTVEAWPVGVDPKQKPLYSITAEGVQPKTVNAEVLTILRGLEEVDWWTVYRLGNGQRLFDTYVPLVDFSISRETLTRRYVGLEIPEDDAKDARLRARNVIGVLTYASGERVIREALLTADDAKKAALLRSFDDSTRTVSYSSGAVQLFISQNYPSAPATVGITIPVVKDDLDFTKATLPAGLHVAPFKR